MSVSKTPDTARGMSYPWNLLPRWWTFKEMKLKNCRYYDGRFLFHINQIVTTFLFSMTSHKLRKLLDDVKQQLNVSCFDQLTVDMKHTFHNPFLKSPSVFISLNMPFHYSGKLVNIISCWLWLIVCLIIWRLIGRFEKDKWQHCWSAKREMFKYMFTVKMAVCFCNQISVLTLPSQRTLLSLICLFWY